MLPRIRDILITALWQVLGAAFVFGLGLIVTRNPFWLALIVGADAAMKLLACFLLGHTPRQSAPPVAPAEGVPPAQEPLEHGRKPHYEWIHESVL